MSPLKVTPHWRGQTSSVAPLKGMDHFVDILEMTAYGQNRPENHETTFSFHL